MSKLLSSLLEIGHTRLENLPGQHLSWLKTTREANLAALSQTGLPTQRNENWKYTAIRALENRTFSLTHPDFFPEELKSENLQLSEISENRVVFVNGCYRADLSCRDKSLKGVSLETLHKMLEEKEESSRFFLNRYFSSTSSNGFSHLNTAFATDGAIIRISSNTSLKTPIHLVFVGAPVKKDLIWNLRNIIEIGENSNLTVVEHYLGMAPHPHFGNSYTQTVMGENAKVNWYRLQQESEQATLVQRHELTLAAHASVSITNIEIGAQLSHTEMKIELNGANAKAHIRGVTALHGRQHNDTQLSVRHSMPNGISDVSWRIIADASARGVFHGTIVVDEGAEGAQAQLSNKNLLLSPQAEIDTKPVLEIYTDEIKASHGATVGQLDENSLFYLQSRGIPLAQSRQILIQAFCSTVLVQTEPAEFRHHLESLLAKHLALQTIDEQSSQPIS